MACWKNEVSPHRPQQAGHVVHEENAGEARATGIDSSLSSLGKPAVCADAPVSAIQGGHAGGSGQSVTRCAMCILRHQGPSHKDRLSLDWQTQLGEKLYHVLTPGLLPLKSTHAVLSWVPNSGAIFCNSSQERPESILLHLLRINLGGVGQGETHTHDRCLP